jgi:hypothetical protein
VFLCCCCENFKQPEKHFDPEELNQLEIADIDGFWKDISRIDTSFHAGGALFREYSGFLEGRGFFDDYSAIWISVFENQDTAINAMEFRIEDVAVLIHEGTSDSIKGL